MLWNIFLKLKCKNKKNGLNQQNFFSKHWSNMSFYIMLRLCYLCCTIKFTDGFIYF